MPREPVEGPQPRPKRLLILGAHPDDAEFHAGGLAAAYAQRGDTVKMVSVTDGRAGHHLHPPDELVRLRRAEAARAGQQIGAPYETWDFPDAQLEPSLALRHRLIEEIRTFRPDLVLTHRPVDYHPDHRALGQAVVDAAYLVTVPRVVPHVPHLLRPPVIAYMVDLFRRPAPLQPDVLFDATPFLDTILAMLACHASQFFEFLPYNYGVEPPPADPQDRMAWLRSWFAELTQPRRTQFRAAMEAAWGPERAQRVAHLEVFEISEYAGRLEEAAELFPVT